MVGATLASAHSGKLERGGSAEVEPPGKPEARLADRSLVDDVGAEELDEAARRAETPQRHARCSPESMKKVPSEISPASATTSPTVGANCRGGEQQMPRDRLKFGGRWTLEDSGRDYA